MKLIWGSEQLDAQKEMRMFSAELAKKKVFIEIARLMNCDSESISDDLQLLSEDSALDSMKLVELCLALEDVATEAGFEFDWTSETAMSRTRSFLRSAGSLASEFMAQMESQK